MRLLNYLKFVPIHQLFLYHLGFVDIFNAALYLLVYVELYFEIFKKKCSSVTVICFYLFGLSLEYYQMFLIDVTNYGVMEGDIKINII